MTQSNTNPPPPVFETRQQRRAAERAAAKAKAKAQKITARVRRGRKKAKGQ